MHCIIIVISTIYKLLTAYFIRSISNKPLFITYRNFRIPIFTPKHERNEVFKFILAFMTISSSLMGQSLEKMNWFNEPAINYD